MAREFRPQVGGLVGLDDFPDRRDVAVFHEEVRRDQNEPAHAMILHAAGVPRRNGRAVAVAEQDAALEADRVEQLRQHVGRLALHVVELARQLDGRRASVAGARIDEHAGAGFLREPRGEIAPCGHRAEPLVQHHDGRRRVRARPDHAVLERCAADRELALVRERAHSSLSLKRWIFPVAVFGSASTNSIQRGYFHGLTCALTCSCNSPRRASSRFAPSFRSR
jgi:hypothetical protein